MASACQRLHRVSRLPSGEREPLLRSCARPGREAIALPLTGRAPSGVVGPRVGSPRAVPGRGLHTWGDHVAIIEEVGAREILDSRGNPTVEVEVALDDGTSAGRRCLGRVDRRARGRRAPRRRRRATAARAWRRPSRRCSTRSRPSWSGSRPPSSGSSTRRLIDLDGTPDKSRLGANALLGVSLAVAKAAAESAGCQLFRYVGGPNAHVLPVPMMNILNGGAHADSDVDVQEFMVAPVGRRPSARRCAGARRSTTRSRAC